MDTPTTFTASNDRWGLREVARAKVTTYNIYGWDVDEAATLRAELVETVTRLAGWADHDVEVIG